MNIRHTEFIFDILIFVSIVLTFYSGIWLIFRNPSRMSFYGWVTMLFASFGFACIFIPDILAGRADAELWPIYVALSLFFGFMVREAVIIPRIDAEFWKWIRNILGVRKKE